MRKVDLPRSVTLSALVSCLLSVTAVASDDARKTGLDAHQHGAAEMLVAMEGSILAIEFESPAYNMLGFEHLPSTDEQVAKKDHVLAVLNDWQKVIELPAAGKCENRVTYVDWTAEEQSDGHDGHKDEDAHDHDEHKDEDAHDHDEHKDEDAHDHEAEGETHSEFHLLLEFECSGPVDTITLKAFDEFPLLESVTGVFIHERGQGGATLEAGNATLEL